VREIVDIGAAEVIQWTVTIRIMATMVETIATTVETTTNIINPKHQSDLTPKAGQIISRVLPLV
jgi:hypothetical protein